MKLRYFANLTFQDDIMSNIFYNYLTLSLYVTFYICQTLGNINILRADKIPPTFPFLLL